MKKNWRWWALGVIAVVAFLALGCLFDWNKSEWASWVQAIGSIAAIVAAILISTDQHRQALKRDERAAAQRTAQLLGPPLAVAERAIKRLRQCADHARKPVGADDFEPSSYYLAAASTEIDRFASLPLQDLPYNHFKSSYELLDLLREAQTILDSVVGLRDRQIRAPSPAFQTFEEAIGHVEYHYIAMSGEWADALAAAQRQR